jgi:hypothetical protein
MSITTKEESVDHIEADSITVEVIDKHTGQVFRRHLPVAYAENDNGLILSGENFLGQATQIVLLSDTALHKITEITGSGPDKPRCS